MDGLAWGEAHKLVPVAFGVKKLVLSCVVEDDKVPSQLQKKRVVCCNCEYCESMYLVYT